MSRNEEPDGLALHGNGDASEVRVEVLDRATQRMTGETLAPPIGSNRNFAPSRVYAIAIW